MLACMLLNIRFSYTRIQYVELGCRKGLVHAIIQMMSTLLKLVVRGSATIFEFFLQFFVNSFPRSFSRDYHSQGSHALPPNRL